MNEIVDAEERPDLLPFEDAAVPAAMKRLVADPLLGDMVRFAFPEIPVGDIKEQLLHVASADEFQEVFVRPMLERILKKSCSSFTMGGLEHIDLSCGHLFMSDHRDIVLDGSLLQLALLRCDLPTSEITFGSNLISSPFVEDFGKCNKMYKILRGGSARDLVRNSHILSEHIRRVVRDGRSIWISQRDGRTKDGNDHTDQGLIKMLTLSGGEDVAASLSELHIVPFAISYEYESCDALKARELYMRRRGDYRKAPGEDLRSIITGVKQFKGAIHLEICPPLRPEEIRQLSAGDEGNELLRGVASLIDRRIYEAYRLFPTNYIAYDRKFGTARYAGAEYAPEQYRAFGDYLEQCTEGFDGDREELLGILLDIYATPVENKLAVEA